MVDSKDKEETILGCIKQVVENHLEEEILLKENPGAPKVQWEGVGEITENSR